MPLATIPHQHKGSAPASPGQPPRSECGAGVVLPAFGKREEAAKNSRPRIEPRAWADSCTLSRPLFRRLSTTDSPSETGESMFPVLIGAVFLVITYGAGHEPIAGLSLGAEQQARQQAGAESLPTPLPILSTAM